MLVWLDPSLRAGRGMDGATPPPASEEAGRLIQLRLAAVSQPDPEPVRVAPVPRMPVRAQAAVPADVAGEGASPRRGRPAATAAERLQYRPGPIWTPAPVVYETVEECLRREHAERLAQGIAAAEYARVPVPAPTVAVPQRAGISIPVGPRPLPWGQFVRAPLPDTIRPDATAVGHEAGHRPAAVGIRRAPGCMDTIPPVTPRLPIRW
jgi:hypothetical protein